MKLLLTITQILLILIGLIHIGFAVGEIFFGEYLLKERFGYSPEVAEKANPIVQNAGIYNSFIAAGLFWSAFTVNSVFQLRLFFLICVAIAGIFGGMTLPSKEPDQKNPNTIAILNHFLTVDPLVVGILGLEKCTSHFGLLYLYSNNSSDCCYCISLDVINRWLSIKTG